MASLPRTMEELRHKRGNGLEDGQSVPASGREYSGGAKPDQYNRKLENGLRKVTLENLWT